MRADDDGFINNPKRIQRMIGCNDDDLKLLIAKRFILAFESGVVVVKHWRMHNLIRKDRYECTQYTFEKAMLTLKEDGAYTENDGHYIPVSNAENRLETTWQPNDNQMATQYRLGQSRVGQSSLVEDNISSSYRTNKGIEGHDDEPLDVNTVSAYATSNLQYMSPNNMEELWGYVDDLNDDLVRHAIDVACEMGHRTWGYTRSILNSYVEQGIKTVGEAKAAREKKRASTSGNGSRVVYTGESSYKPNRI